MNKQRNEAIRTNIPVEATIKFTQVRVNLIRSRVNKLIRI